MVVELALGLGRLGRPLCVVQRISGEGHDEIHDVIMGRFKRTTPPLVDLRLLVVATFRFTCHRNVCTARGRPPMYRAVLLKMALSVIGSSAFWRLASFAVNCNSGRSMEKSFNRAAWERYRDASARSISSLLSICCTNQVTLGHCLGAHWIEAPSDTCLQCCCSRYGTEMRLVSHGRSANRCAAAAEVELVNDDVSIALVWLVSDTGVCPTERVIQNAHLFSTPLLVSNFATWWL